jgi:hypothetical protein
MIIGGRGEASDGAGLIEQTFRFNTRKGNDQERFLAAVASVQDRPVTYQQLTGQTMC